MPVDLTRSQPSRLDRPSSQDPATTSRRCIAACTAVVHDNGVGLSRAVVIVAVDNLKIIPGFRVARTPARGSDLEAEPAELMNNPLSKSALGSSVNVPDHTAGGYYLHCNQSEPC